jgi:hypothetical protein
MNSFERNTLHPLFLTTYMVLALLAKNLSEFESWAVLRPLIFALAGTIILLVLLHLILKNWQKAALFTTFLLLLFFTYGQMYIYLRENAVFGYYLGRHRILVPVYFALLVLGLWVITRLKRIATLNEIVNGACLVLMFAPIFEIAVWEVRSASTQPVKTENMGVSFIRPARPPDIYYIILESYTSDDMLKDSFNFNNSQFTNKLKQMGFYVADCSRSNYSEAELSLASSMNLKYLQSFGSDFSNGGKDRLLLYGLMTENQVLNILRSSGYQIVSFETGSHWEQWEDGDHYITSGARSVLQSSLRPFEARLLNSTAAILLTDWRALSAKNDASPMVSSYRYYINRELYKLDQLNYMPSMAGPKFVFAHILLPAPPLVFTATGAIQSDPGYYSNAGQPIDNDYFNKGYINQVQFLNRRILPILGNIISQSKVMPIIILQGDRGVEGNDQHAILNAYFLPGGGESWLYRTVSPVNTFRVIFNAYFKGHLPLLPDQSFFIDEANQGQFMESRTGSIHCPIH